MCEVYAHASIHFAINTFKSDRGRGGEWGEGGGGPMLDKRYRTAIWHACFLPNTQ